MRCLSFLSYCSCHQTYRAASSLVRQLRHTSFTSSCTTFSARDVTFCLSMRLGLKCNLIMRSSAYQDNVRQTFCYFVNACVHVSIIRNRRRRAKALLDFERHDDDELGFRKNDIVTVRKRRAVLIQALWLSSLLIIPYYGFTALSLEENSCVERRESPE